VSKDKSPALHWLNAGAVCLNFNLRRTARAVTQYYDDALKPTGVKSTQFSVLMAVASSSTPENDAVEKKVTFDNKITDIARLAQCDRTTLTRSLKILETDKFIEVRKSEPGNVRRVFITARGIKKMKEIYPFWFHAQRELAKALSPGKTRDLRHLLQDAKTAAEAMHAG
jgi:DNA-binding MarR family transcriptional regulator